MGRWCLHASSFIFVRIIIKVAGNQGRQKKVGQVCFWAESDNSFWSYLLWVTKISHFWIWISLKPVGQFWSNFMCSIIGVGERLHKVLGQIDLGTLDSGEWSLPFGLLVYYLTLWKRCYGYLVNPRGLTDIMCNFGSGVSAMLGLSLFTRYVLLIF